MILPNTTPLLLGRGYDDIIKAALSDPDNHLLNIMRISKVCRIKITFSIPQTIWITRRKRYDNVSEHVFPEFFVKGDTLYYLFKRGGCTGLPVSFKHIQSYEPIIESVDEFKTYEDFKKKFDTQFITEDQIKNLWDSTSAQHGGKYKPSDFKPISKSGKEALRYFLADFKGVHSTDPTGYRDYTFEGNTYHHITGTYYGSGGNGSRDIRVSHRLGSPQVSYSSEYQGCGNGSYGLLATKSTYLWLEDD
jgi:hypothetical protein